MAKRKSDARKKEHIFFRSEETQDKQGDFNVLLDLGADLAQEVKREAIEKQQEALRRKREAERMDEEEDDE